MTVVEDTNPHPAAPEAARCPIDHSQFTRKKSIRPEPEGTALLERDAQGVWQVRGFEEARAILRSNATRQAGFKAELVVTGQGLDKAPILYQEGKAHQDQRTKTARFFTPKTVSTNYRELMETLSDQLVADLRRTGQADLSAISMGLAIQVTGRVVGLTNSSIPGLIRRIQAFFDDTSLTNYRGIFGTLVSIFNLHRMLSFYWFDVRPAIAARRKTPQEDVISHLIAQGYDNRAILTECVTYGAAGMVTTREFICMAAWHLLESPDLRARYLAAPEEERLAILHEILRLEPVVGHLYRRATADIPLQAGDSPVVIPEGALINLHVETANLDERVVGPDPAATCPGRPLQGDRVGPMLMSFGDGAHRCPGAYLAIQETDIFLQRLLVVPGLRVVQPPTLTWNEITAGYELRRFMLAAGPA